MARIIWSPEAGRRLIDIDAYLRIAAPERADAIVEHIMRQPNDLMRQPNDLPRFRDWEVRFATLPPRQPVN